MDIDKSISLPRRTSLVQQCVRSILEYVSKQALKLGDRLPSHQELASMLGVSILVVREALQALNALGLIEVRHGQGTFVRGIEEANFLELLAYGTFGQASLKDVVEARAMLELTALEACIANAGPAEIARLEEALVKMRAPRDPNDQKDYHVAFHRELLRCSGNQLLYAIGVPLFNTFMALAGAGSVPPVDQNTLQRAENHALYVDAIKNRDSAHSREIVDLHLRHLPSQLHVFPFNSNGSARMPEREDEQEKP